MPLHTGAHPLAPRQFRGDHTSPAEEGQVGPAKHPFPVNVHGSRYQ
jgi:hypothetical protein